MDSHSLAGKCPLSFSTISGFTLGGWPGTGVAIAKRAARAVQAAEKAAADPEAAAAEEAKAVAAVQSRLGVVAF